MVFVIRSFKPYAVRYSSEKKPAVRYSSRQNMLLSTGPDNTWFSLTLFRSTYKNQSIGKIKVISSIGSPTAVKTIAMVTRPACGIPAAPIAAAVAVRLKHEFR